MAPKSILKNKSSAHAGPSSAGRGGKNGGGGGRDMERNTRINAGSKFQKSLQVERGAGGSVGGRGKGKAKAGGRLAQAQARRGRDGDVNEDYVSDEGESSDGFGDEDMSHESADTDEEIARGAGGADKKKGTKRKRTATTAETFGSTLTSLLAESTVKPKKSKKAAEGADNDDDDDDEAKPTKKTKAAAAPTATSAILSLSHARPPPSRSAENLERKAKRHLQVLKEEKEDRARVRDVVEGWAAKPIGVNGEVVGGQEFEKGLRKTAQRGVIKLFNAILIAAKNAEAATTSLSAKAGVKDESWKGGKREKDNIMGRGGKEAGLTQESFLDLVRKG